MEEIINVCVNNGLGVASFIALIVFIFKYMGKANDTLDKINTSLTALTIRVEKIENRVNKEG